MLREPVFEIVEEAPDEEGLLGEVAEATQLSEAAEQHTGAMVALYPDAATAAELAIKDGEHADDLHVTLVFLGKAASLDLGSVLTVVSSWASMCPSALEGEISGVGRFAMRPPVTYLSVDLPELPHLRQRLVEELESVNIAPSKDHGYTPHMTLDYAPRRPKITQPIPISFDKVTVRWAGERYDLPLGQPVSSIAKLLQEGKWDAKLHPRWPKGTPKAGQFIEVGDRFKSADGKEWEVSHLFGGKVVANRVDGNFKNAATGVFGSQQEGEHHVVKDAVAEGAPVAITSSQSKGLESGVATIDPYVDPSTHDPSIQLPEASSLKPEEWQRFGKIDQEHYVELMQRFGKYSPSKAKPLIDESYKDYEGSVQDIVKNAYSAQYGSSSGFSLSLGSIFKSFSGKKADLPKLDAQRKRALQLQGRHRDVIAWDLYNRCHAPDVTVFHKNTNGPSYWKPMLSGEKPIFSGLSQSWNFSANWGFGDNTLATPLAIRHVLMSSYSAQPIPGNTSFPGEYEISVPEQIKVDGKRSFYFQLFDISQNQKKWLMGSTKAPAGGQVLEQFRDAVQKKEHLPTPPAPPDVQMQGQSQKLWIDPPAEAAEFAKRFEGKLPPIKSSPYSPGELEADGPWANKDQHGDPVATVAKQSELKPGDYMMGLKGTLYLIVEDPGDPEGFGLRYVKIVDGKFTGESYNFEGGGKNAYYKLSEHYALADPTKKSHESELFDPNAWVNSEGAKFTGELAEGDKFKVNGNPYEVKNQLGHHTQILDLMTGKVGTINTDYKTPTLEPKENYVPEESEEGTAKLQPAKGMTFAYGGEKHTITKVLKDGTVKAKPSGGKVIAVGADDSALDSLYDPGAHKIGEKVKVGDLEPGDLFHGGKGQSQRPYVVMSKSGSTVHWKSLDTGDEGDSKAHKTVRFLHEQEPGPEPTKQSGPDAPDSLEPGTQYAIKNLPVGHVFLGPYADEKYKVIENDENPEKPVVVAKLGANGTFVGGPGLDVPPGQAVQYVGGPDYKPAAEAPAMSGGGLADHQAEGGFEPYGSPYGSGGKYKHDKLGSMPVGTVFKGKEGKLWKVKSNDADLIVTDGQQLYKADPTVRGRAVDADFTDESGALPGPGNDPVDVNAATMAVPNDAGLTLGQVPEGSTVFYADNAYKVGHTNSVTGGVELTNLGTGLSDSYPPQSIPSKISEAEAPNLDEEDLPNGLKINNNGSILGAQTQGTLVEIAGKQWIVGEHNGDETVTLHPRGGGQTLPFGVMVKPDAIGPVQSDDAWKPKASQVIASMPKGHSFTAADGNNYTVIAKAANGTTIVKADAGGGTDSLHPVPEGKMSSNWSPLFNKGAAAFKEKPKTLPQDAPMKINFKVSPPPDSFSIKDLKPGDKFTTMTGTNEVVAHTVDGKTVIKTDKGALGQWDSNSILKGDQKVEPEVGSATVNMWSDPVEKALHQAGQSMGEVGSVELDGYGSKWGSGGKYIHYRLEELEAGATAKDKTGNVVNVIGPGPDGKTLVYSHGVGALFLADSKTRLRRVEA